MKSADELGELKQIEGADWDVEIGAITEIGHHLGEQSRALVFDHIKGYPAGYRVLSNTLNTVKRMAMTLHMDTNYSRNGFVKDIKRHITDVKYVKPEVVKDGPVMENVFEGKDINMWKFPTPKWHELDGGRYIGTGSVDITRDPDDGWVNLGTYRVMVHDENTLGFYISPGKQGRIMREKYWAKGETCKVAVSFGQDPLLYLAGGMEVPHGVSEYDWVGGLSHHPVQVIQIDGRKPIECFLGIPGQECGSRISQTFVIHAFKTLHIFLGHAIPYHVSRVQICAFSHGVSCRPVVQKFDRFRSDRLWIVERDQCAALIVQ